MASKSKVQPRTSTQSSSVSPVLLLVPFGRHSLPIARLEGAPVRCSRAANWGLPRKRASTTSDQRSRRLDIFHASQLTERPPRTRTCEA
jgi:hypothetical protein